MITFLEQYQRETTWSRKVIIMELYHLVQTNANPEWNQINTSEYFGVSRAIVSENLKIARASHDDERIMKIKTREEALERVK